MHHSSPCASWACILQLGNVCKYSSSSSELECMQASAGWLRLAVLLAVQKGRQSLWHGSLLLARLRCRCGSRSGRLPCRDLILQAWDHWHALRTHRGPPSIFWCMQQVFLGMMAFDLPHNPAELPPSCTATHNLHAYRAAEGSAAC